MRINIQRKEHMLSEVEQVNNADTLTTTNKLKGSISTEAKLIVNNALSVHKKLATYFLKEDMNFIPDNSKFDSIYKNLYKFQLSA